MEKVLFFAFTMFVLYGLETIIPLVKSQRNSKKRILSNTIMIALALLVYMTLSVGVTWLALKVSENNVGILNWLGFNNAWAVSIVGILVLDYCAAYLPHVLMHKIPFMWRFHAVHHSDKAIDITTALRQHPFESIWRVMFQVIAVVVFGIPLYVLTLYLTLTALWAQIEHANIKIPSWINRVQLLFVTPNMHKLHHSQWQKETDTNYGNIFSIWDRVFHTYSERTNYDDIKYGLENFPKPDYSVKEMLVDIPANSVSQISQQNVNQAFVEYEGDKL
ncbi:sterol desaturase family protein [Oscillatoria amoena NRMC-F 0135]|nr:sterol desaturase family protein [Oscillatoria amoena NRMC-F 0135]